MSIAHTVVATTTVDNDLHIHAEGEDGNDLRVLVRSATMPLSAGDHLSFGCAGVQYEDGSVFGGNGYVTHDGEEYPYRRVSDSVLVEGWNLPSGIADTPSR